MRSPNVGYDQTEQISDGGYAWSGLEPTIFCVPR